MADEESNDILCPTTMAILAACPIEAQGAIGRAPCAWANHLQPGLGDQFELDHERITRDRLLSLAREGSPDKFFLSAMAWGGMRVDHGQAAWAARETWIKPLSAALAGGHSRGELYEQFAAVPVGGMRAAYFTKLIHFASVPRVSPVGYIMDQWTAKSVNLIRRQEVVALDAAGFVRPINDRHAYEAFCKVIDAIGAHLQIDGAKAEERIYSRGGRRRAPWRAYVKATWRPVPRRRREDR